MPPRCCPTCRMLAPSSARRCAHCGAETVPPWKVARPVVSGVTTIQRRPATGWRDAVALIATSFGTFGAAIAGAFAVGPVGLLAGPAFALLGYSKQFWRTALARRDRVLPIATPRAPPGDPLVGVAQPHERTLPASALSPTGTGGAASDGDDARDARAASGADARPLLAVATTLGLDGGILVRRIEAVPFWVVRADGTRVLVDGVVWLASPSPARDDASARDVLATTQLPLARRARSRVTLARTVLRAGDTLAASGTIAPAQLAGTGYRDHLIDAMRGDVGRPVWLERGGEE